MTSLGGHLRLVKNVNLCQVSAKILAIICDFSCSKTRNCYTSQHITPHVLGFGFRARGLGLGQGLRLRVYGLGLRVQGL